VFLYDLALCLARTLGDHFERHLLIVQGSYSNGYCILQVVFSQHNSRQVIGWGL
jgi:hypothetical protein